MNIALVLFKRMNITLVLYGLGTNQSMSNIRIDLILRNKKTNEMKSEYGQFPMINAQKEVRFQTIEVP